MGQQHAKRQGAVISNLPVGWISPEGVWYATPQYEAHIHSFLSGQIPIPASLRDVQLQDDLHSVALVVDAGFIRVSAGTFTTKDLSRGVLERVEDHLLDFLERYSRIFSPQAVLHIDPVHNQHGGRTLVFTWREFISNDFKIPMPSWYTLSQQDTVSSGGFRRTTASRVLAIYRQAVSQEVLRALFQPRGNLAILSAERRELGTGENTRRKTRLIQDLQRGGYRYTSARGIFGGVPEDAVIAWDIPAGVAFDLMARYGQTSIIYKALGAQRPVYYDQDGRYKVFGTELKFGSLSDEILEDRTQMRRDPNQRFRIEFDWDHPMPWRLSPAYISQWEEARAEEQAGAQGQKAVAAQT